MKNPAIPVSSSIFRRSVCLVVAVLMLPWMWNQAGLLQAQISHTDYLNAIGYEDDGIVMRSLIEAGLRAEVPGESDQFYTQNSSFFSMVLLLSGVRPLHFYQLNEAGIDIIHAITSDSRPFSEQSLLADLIILGEVTDLQSADDRGDGFDVTVEVSIVETLKGISPSETVQIRQRNANRLADSTTRPEPGGTYLFLLSSGMYGFHSATYQLRSTGEAQVRAPNLGEEKIFLIYRMYPYRQGEVGFTSYTFDVIRQGIEKADNVINPK